MSDLGVRAAARKEAERLYPTPAWLDDPPMIRSRRMMQQAYIAGAVWVVGCLPTRDEIAEAVAAAQNVPFPGKRQERIADAVLALIRSKLT